MFTINDKFKAAICSILHFTREKKEISMFLSNRFHIQATHDPELQQNQEHQLINCDCNKNSRKSKRNVALLLAKHNWFFLQKRKPSENWHRLQRSRNNCYLSSCTNVSDKKMIRGQIMQKQSSRKKVQLSFFISQMKLEVFNLCSWKVTKTKPSRKLCLYLDLMRLEETFERTENLFSYETHNRFGVSTSECCYLVHEAHEYGYHRERQWCSFVLRRRPLSWNNFRQIP